VATQTGRKSGLMHGYKEWCESWFGGCASVDGWVIIMISLFLWGIDEREWDIWVPDSGLG